MPLSDKIGPMGYGIEQDPDNLNLLKDKVYISKLASETPMQFVRRAPKKGNDRVLSLVNDALQKDGFEPGSMSLRYLSVPLFGECIKWSAQLIGSCFPAGTLIRMADGSLKPIEEIHVFNQVLTAEGNISYVSTIMGRNISEDIVELKLWGHTNGLRLTKEHPVLTKRGYIKASELTTDDMVCIPRYISQTSKVLQTADHVTLNRQMRRRIAIGDTVGSHYTTGESVKVYRKVPDLIDLDYNFGWLIGVALAEGGTDGNKVVFTFNSNEAETLAQKVIDIFNNNFNIEASLTYPKTSTCKVSVHSVAWASMFDSLIGKRPEGKRLHGDLACGPKEFLLGVWEGWISGDGYQKNDSRVQGTTVSKQLALNMYNIAHALGMEPTFNGTQPKISHGVKHRHRRYDVYVSNKQLNINVEDKQTWRKVRSIDFVSYSGKVYNFEVNGDNSYVADGIGVHNCVASGAMRAITYRTLAEILVFGDLEYMLGYEVTGMNSVAPFAPYHYGCGRRRGGLRGGDGSFCGAQIEALQKDGILMCSAPGLSKIVGTNTRDYPETQDTRLYRQFGDWKYLDDFVEEARRIRLAESNVIDYRNIEEDREDCVVGLKPAMICSNWGFAPSYKHKDGFWVYKRSGQWAHNMTRSGYRVATDGNWFVEITNSWGPDAHRDGEHFYVPIEVFEQWMRQANAATIGELDLIDQAVPVL